MAVELETRAIVQLSRPVAVPSGAFVPMQVEGAPAVAVPVEALFSKYLGTAASYSTLAELEADLDHPNDALALVYSDPDPNNSIYYVKSGAAGAGSWLRTNMVVGSQGPANNTCSNTAALEAAAVSNVSAILAEAGKAGTFTIRDYADFTAEVAADVGKVNYVRSTVTPDKVWVRTTILPSAAAQIGMGDGRDVETAMLDKPDARAVITASEAIGAGKFVNVYNSGGAVRARQAIASDPTKFANGYAPAAIANGASGAIFFLGLNSTVAVPVDAAEAWLSDVTPGGFSTSPPTAEGSIIQSLGPAIAGLGIFFTFRERVLL